MSWPNKLQDFRERRAAEKQANLAVLMLPSRTLHRGTYGPATLEAAPKGAQPIRSEAYRRLVAQLPCINCGVEGFSQAAHPPATARGRKESDLECFALCCARPGIEGCHIAFDQCRLIPGNARRGQAVEWAQKTRSAIRRAGLWPKGLGEWDDKSGRPKEGKPT